jgi:putative isomerase
MTVLTPDRAWSTWDQRHPAAMMHLPSRFAVRVALFSATENRYDAFPAERIADLELGEHAWDGDYVALQVRSAGTTLGIEFAKGRWSGVSARIRILQAGEMIFRLGIMVEAGFLAPPQADPDLPEARMVDGRERSLSLVSDPDAEHLMASQAGARWRSQCFHVAVSPTPTMSGQYSARGDVADDLQRRGWLYHPPPAPDGDWIAWRMVGNPREVIRVAVAQDSDPAPAAAAARARLTDVDETIERARARARGAGSPPARTLRDVMAWNTVWDEANHRPYTALSRGWLRGFGGWGIWMSDAFYATLMCARAGDVTIARANLDAVLGAAQAAGNIPCLVAGDEEWVDRTQLPVGAFMTWRTYLLCGERSLLSEAYPVLARHLAWVARERDGNHNGLYEYGSSPTGHAQWAGTKQGALNESGMDNLAVFDDARFVVNAHTIDLEDPGHNSLLALEWESLGHIARQLGRVPEAEAHAARARTLAQAISHELWDPEREIFAARHWDGTFAAHVSPTSFFPLVAGAASEAQIDAMLRRHLLCEDEFWGPLPLPSAPFSDPVSGENSYWRGRIWPPMLYWTWEGLRRVGRGDVAHELARRAWEMFDAEWTAHRHSHENFHSRDPAGHEAHDSDPFYSWGALIALMWESERGDASPWEGIVLAPGGALMTPRGMLRAEVDGEWMRVLVDGAEAFAVSPPARLCELVIEPDHVTFTVASECRLTVSRRPSAAMSDGGAAEVCDSGDGTWTLRGARGRVSVRYDMTSPTQEPA